MANDLKSTLLIDSIQDTAWWGRYDFLDDYSAPPATAAILRQAQIKCLKNTTNVNTQAANTMLFKLRTAMDKLNPEVQHQDTVVAIEQAIDAALVKLLNAGLAAHRDNMTQTHLSGKNTAEQARRKANNIRMASTLLTKLTSELGQQVSPADLAAFQSAMQEAYEAIEPEGRNWDYTKLKAAEAEELVTMMINAMPEYQAFTTGAWMDSKGKQLIEDNFVFPKSVMTMQLPMGITLQAKISEDKYETRTINKLQDLQEISVPIKLSDELYDELKKLKLFSVQVKSGLGGSFNKKTGVDTRGIGQGLLNTLPSNMRNQVSIGEIGGLNGVDAAVGLYKSEPQWFKDGGVSSTVNAIANANLSKNIALTNLKANEVYFTIYGFVTAAEWMEQSNQYVKFASPIRWTPDILEQKRALMFALEKA